MTLARKNGTAKAGQAQNAGTSQAVPQNAVDNLFDGLFYVEPINGGFILWTGRARSWSPRYYTAIDDLMTFLADQAIAKMGRVEQ